MLPYQISYELPLGVPQATWPVFVALVLVATAVVAPPTAVEEATVDQAGGADRGRAGTVTAVLAVAPVLVVPAVLALTGPGSAREDGSGPAGEERVRVATYNLHSGVGTDGRLDPDRIADVLEEGGAEVMALQEVARGWPLAGGIDLASWLGRRLDAQFVYGPAADHQFGNAVLSTRPIQRWRSGTMPKGEGPMRRGWVAASVAFDDDVLEVFSIHLQHQDDTTATRQDQARLVLAAWDGAERTVLAGDLNSRPGSPDIAPWFDATGLVSAQADGEIRPTSPADAPDHTIDWILGTPDLAFRDVDVPATTASDHLPIFADVTRSP
nr:endonuclease/exonuclease/phosphatase family protein [Salsipaludibacter albus]